MMSPSPKVPLPEGERDFEDVPHFFRKEGNPRSRIFVYLVNGEKIIYNELYQKNES